jgi:hypothetical protein
MEARNERRRRGVTELLRRLADRARPVVPRSDVVNVIHVLLSFDTFHAIAGEHRTPEDAIPTMRRLVRAVLGIPPDARRA